MEKSIRLPFIVYINPINRWGKTRAFCKTRDFSSFLWSHIAWDRLAAVSLSNRLDFFFSIFQGVWKWELKLNIIWGGLFLEKVICWEYLSFIQEESQPGTMAGIRSNSQLLQEKRSLHSWKSRKKNVFMSKANKAGGEGMRKFKTFSVCVYACMYCELTSMYLSVHRCEDMFSVGSLRLYYMLLWK